MKSSEERDDKKHAGCTKQAMLQLQLRSVEDDASIGTDSFSSTPPRRRAAPKGVADDGTRTMPSKVFS